MAGTTQGWSSVYIPRGQRVDLYGGLAVPAAGARLSLYTDLTPDATANPSAVHLGRTTEGVEISWKPSYDFRRSDDFSGPYDSLRNAEEVMISANILQTLDFTVMAMLLEGATKNTGSGYEELTFGDKAGVTKLSFAVIFKLPEDAAKVSVVQIYSGINDAGLAMRVRRNGDPASTPIAIHGFTVDSRAAGDRLMKWFKQVA